MINNNIYAKPGIILNTWLYVYGSIGLNEFI